MILHPFPFRLCHLAIIPLLMLAVQAPLFAVPIRFLPWDEEVAAREISVKNGKHPTKLKDLHPHQRSNPFDLAVGEVPLQLIALDRKKAGGKPVALEIKVAPEFLSPLVLILADAKHPTGLRTFVIEDDATRFAWGTARMVNASGNALLIRVEKTITPLPVSWEPVEIAPGGSARNIGVQLVARDKLKDILYSAVWEHDPDVRNLAFIVPADEVGTGALDIKIIPENRRGLATKAEARP